MSLVTTSGTSISKSTRDSKHAYYLASNEKGCPLSAPAARIGNAIPVVPLPAATRIKALLLDRAGINTLARYLSASSASNSASSFLALRLSEVGT